jgi:hypothetical protein
MNDTNAIVITQSAHDLAGAIAKDPAALSIIAILIGLGWMMQQFPVWPDKWNKGIPWVLLAMGMIMALLWLPTSLFPATQRHPESLIGGLGAVMGVVAVAMHMTDMQWVINKINSYFPSKP